jgi:hypothetical protein
MPKWMAAAESAIWGILLSVMPEKAKIPCVPSLQDDTPGHGPFDTIPQGSGKALRLAPNQPLAAPVKFPVSMKGQWLASLSPDNILRGLREVVKTIDSFGDHEDVIIRHPPPPTMPQWLPLPTIEVTPSILVSNQGLIET